MQNNQKLILLKQGFKTIGGVNTKTHTHTYQWTIAVGGDIGEKTGNPFDGRHKARAPAPEGPSIRDRTLSRDAPYW